MVPNRQILVEPVFAEYEPVELERAFKVKNRIKDEPSLISTKGRRKDYLEMPEPDLD
jgi:hypothetical protein